MLSQVSQITREATCRSDDIPNILCADTHEAQQVNQCRIRANFYAMPHKTFKVWNPAYRPIPDNYHHLRNGFPLDLDFDIILSQNKYSQFQIFSQIAEKNNIPLISLEHTDSHDSWPRDYLKSQWTNKRGDINLFISRYSVERWGFSHDDPTVRVVNHGIDTSTFCPANVEKKNRIIVVVNDYINRDKECNFSGFMRTASDLPVVIYGDTPKLSKPASSVEQLISEYQSSRIFYNTSLISPCPTSLFEAMSCGLACVSTATCAIPEIIQNGVNGFISNDEKELRGYLEMLLSDEKLATELGNNARKTILERYSLQQFVDSWNKIFRELL
jgi:glycosyltransferase involved in cell wall biosynthesis